MKRFSLLFAALLTLLLPWAAPAHAATLTDQDRADVARIETYLNSFRTMSGRFLQVGADGLSSEGKVWLSRPGRMRFEYDPPVPILVVGDGTFVIFHDKELGQIDRIPLGATPLAFILRDEVKLSGSAADKVAVDKVERQRGLLRVTLLDTARPKEGRLTLTFSDGPLTLRQWQVIDAQGKATNITLNDMALNETLPGRLFVFIDPTPRGGNSGGR